MSDRLFPCPDCGISVSPRAAACPKCGAPIAAKAARVHRAGARWEGIGFVLILAGIAMWFGGTAGWITGGMATGLVGFIVFIIGRFK